MSRALVISGGGCKGAFAVGVIKRLLQQYPKLSFDMFVGTSTGSLIAPLVAMNEIALLENLYTSLTTGDIVIEGRVGDLLSETAIFDSSPLWKLLTHHYTDERYTQLLATGKPVFLTTVCLQTGGLVVFTTEKNPPSVQNYQLQTLISADQFRKAVMASASQPVFMDPVLINKNVPGDPHPNYQYVDGGVREYAGVEIAINNGATEIFTILLSPDTKSTDNITYANLFGILQKTIDIFTDDVGKNDLIIPEQYNEALWYIDAVKNKMLRSGLPQAQVNEYFNIDGKGNPFEDKRPLKLFMFRPDAPLGGGPGGLTFDAAEMAGMVAKGENTVNEFITDLNGAEISWA